MKKVTSTDVARLAGVSQSTVSMVLNLSLIHIYFIIRLLHYRIAIFS